MAKTSVGRWIIIAEDKGVRFQPIWGASYVMPNLFGHSQAPGADTQAGIKRVLFTSATLMGAEYIADVILQSFDFTIAFGMGFFHGGQHFGDMYRYTFPETVVFTQYISRENFEQLHYSFVMGFRLFLAPGQQCDLLTSLDDGFVRRVADIVRLYRKHAGVLLRGRFLSVEPIEADDPELVARAYESPAGCAVAVWNPTDRTRELTIRWPGKKLAFAETPAGDMLFSAGPPALDAGQVAVLLFE